jgi:CheY-like chemotaxis protein
LRAFTDREKTTSMRVGAFVETPNPFTKVLLVDDNYEQLELRALILRMAGFSVLTAQGPTEALSLVATSGTPDFAIVDYEMPMMNGGVLAQHLKARFPKLSIILYSGRSGIPSQELSCVDKFISKDEGAIALVDHLWNASMRLGQSRGGTQTSEQYSNPESPPHVTGG